MRPTEPLALHHSWPLFEQGRRFGLGHLFDDVVAWPPIDRGALAARGIGLWECDLLEDNALTWSPEVYDLFDLPRDAAPTRGETVALYCEPSRVAMERLRAHAIAHRRGFTLDAEILPARVRRRWMRLTVLPLCHRSRVVGLRGLKQDITHEYR